MVVPIILGERVHSVAVGFIKVGVEPGEEAVCLRCKTINRASPHCLAELLKHLFVKLVRVAHVDSRQSIGWSVVRRSDPLGNQACVH